MTTEPNKPVLPTAEEWLLLMGREASEQLAFLRERGLIAQEPDSIDRLRDALADLHGIRLDREKMQRVFRHARIELEREKRPVLTREMVEACSRKAYEESIPTGWPDSYFDRLTYALQEQLK